MTLNDLMNKKEYSKFKLASADYDETEDMTTLTFLYPENDDSLDTLKSQLKEEVKNFIGELGKYKLKFKQSYVDADLIFSELVNFETQQFPYLKGIFKREDVHIVKNDKILITLDCDKEVEQLVNKYKFSENFIELLKNNFFEEIELNFNPCKQVEEQKFDEETSSQSELLRIFEQEAKLNKVEVSEAVCIYGKEIQSGAKFIKDISKKDTEVVIAGKISGFAITKFIPKSQKDKENPIQKNKVAFTLTDASGSIDIVVFPSENDVQKLEKLSDGCEILVNGSPSEFSEKVNIRANAISICKVLTKEVQYIWREPTKEYKIVKPKPMVDLQQMDLFSFATNNVPTQGQNEKGLLE